MTENQIGKIHFDKKVILFLFDFVMFEKNLILSPYVLCNPSFYRFLFRCLTKFGGIGVFKQSSLMMHCKQEQLFWQFLCAPVFFQYTFEYIKMLTYLRCSNIYRIISLLIKI
jgi:hypothetical protein